MANDFHKDPDCLWLLEDSPPLILEKLSDNSPLKDALNLKLPDAELSKEFPLKSGDDDET